MQMSAYFFFHGRTEEAMKFYQSALGGELEISRNRDAPFAADLPKDSLDDVLHATLRGNDFTLMASDNRPNAHQEQSPNIALCLNFTDEPKCQEVFKALSIGATITVPLQKAFWGALFTEFTDQYGINWMLNCG
jgi:PhnB protein